MAELVRVWDDRPGPERVLIAGRTLTLRRSPTDAPPWRAPRGRARRDVPCLAGVRGRDRRRSGEPAQLLAAHPGCLVAVAVTRWACLLAAGGVQARLDPALGGTCTLDDATAYASALHAWLVTGGQARADPAHPDPHEHGHSGQSPAWPGGAVGRSASRSLIGAARGVQPGVDDERLFQQQALSPGAAERARPAHPGLREHGHDGQGPAWPGGRSASRSLICAVRGRPIPV